MQALKRWPERRSIHMAGKGGDAGLYFDILRPCLSASALASFSTRSPARALCESRG